MLRKVGYLGAVFRNYLCGIPCHFSRCRLSSRFRGSPSDGVDEPAYKWLIEQRWKAPAETTRARETCCES